MEKELEVAKEMSRLQGELHVARQRLENLQTTVSVLKEVSESLVHVFFPTRFYSACYSALHQEW